MQAAVRSSVASSTGRSDISVDQPVEKAMKLTDQKRGDCGRVHRSRPAAHSYGGCLTSFVLAALTPLSPAMAQASSPSTVANPTALVDALNGVFGKQTTGRAIHAKGIVLEGNFVASPSARSLSSAAH